MITPRRREARAAECRRRAAGIAEATTERLVSPVEVARVAMAPGNVDEPPGMAPLSPWHPASHADGHPGIALLFAELGSPEIAHAHLAAARDRFPARRPDAAASMAFAMSAVQRVSGGFASALGGLNRTTVAWARTLLAPERSRIAAMRPGARGYDAAGGATGAGRYLLSRGPEYRPVVREVLSYLVLLTDPLSAKGRVVPGWQDACGQLTPGLAHGIAGPLALLAVAWRHGVRAPRQDEAIGRIAGWLLHHCLPGPQWPYVVTPEERPSPVARTPAAPSWCYGTPGVARALQLAGRALGETEWERTAVRALTASLSRIDELADHGLCHGKAGTLQIAWRMARDSGDPFLTACLPDLADQVMCGYDPDLPFGFRYAERGHRVAGDRPGFVEGAAGIALALHTYARDAEPASGWDELLLLT